MKILADENQHPVVIARLRDAGYTVEAVKDTMPGAQDADILGRTDIGSLTIVTYDRDFGNLIFNHGCPSPAALIYTRLSRAEPALIARRLLTLLASGIVAGHITTITKDGERIRPFPRGVSNG